MRAASFLNNAIRASSALHGIGLSATMTDMKTVTLTYFDFYPANASPTAIVVKVILGDGSEIMSRERGQNPVD